MENDAGMEKRNRMLPVILPDAWDGAGNGMGSRECESGGRLRGGVRGRNVSCPVSDRRGGQGI